MARCLDENGEDASLLDKKLKELMAESISRKQKEGRKRSRVEKELAEEDKQRRFVQLHEQFERLVAELPPAKERTEEQKQQLKKIAQKKWKIKNKLDGNVDHLIPQKEQEEDTVAKEAEQEQEQVEVHSKKSESSPAKNEKGKKKVGRPAKNEKRKNTVRILLIYIIFLKPFLLSMLHYCHNMHTSN